MSGKGGGREAFVNEPVFDTARANDGEDNDLNTMSLLHQFPTLPSLLQPSDRADSPASLTLRSRTSSDGNGGSWHSDSLHVLRSNSSVSKQSDNVGIDMEDDDDFELHAALRRSIVEVEGGGNDDGEWRGLTCTCVAELAVNGCVFACVIFVRTSFYGASHAALPSHNAWSLPWCTDDNFERELQLALEISRREAMESGVLQLEDADYCVGSTEA